MRTQLDEFRSRLLLHFPFDFTESSACAGKKSSRKRKLDQKSPLEQLALVRLLNCFHIFLDLCGPASISWMPAPLLQPSAREFNLLICELVLTLESLTPPLPLPPNASTNKQQSSVRAEPPQHAFVLSALAKASRSRGGNARGAGARVRRTRESDVEQTSSNGIAHDSDEEDVDRVRRYLHEHSLDERLRLREALVVARLLGTLQLEWPGTLH